MPTGTDAPATATARPGPPRRRAALTPAILGGSGTVLMGLFACSEATVAAGGTLTEPLWAPALGVLALTTAGVLGPGWLFVGNRRRGACGGGRC